MTDARTSTLAELVTANPAAARIFERFGLDFCCHGRQTLADACDRAGVDAATVADELSATPDSDDRDWVELDPPALADHVVEVQPPVPVGGAAAPRGAGREGAVGARRPPSRARRRAAPRHGGAGRPRAAFAQWDGAEIDFAAAPAADWKPFDAALEPAPGGTEHEVTFHATETVKEVVNHLLAVPPDRGRPDCCTAQTCGERLGVATK